MNHILLYKNDYQRIPGIIDTKTTNTSFIKMAMVLKKMGIKNHSFMLFLTQPELQGVDPFSPNLTERQKNLIGIECKINPWYCFRECIRIPVQGVDDPIPYILNRANLATMWLFFNNIDLMLTMPRQIGKTVCSLALTVYNLFIAGDNITIGLFAKGGKLQTENVKRVKAIRDALPTYLWMSGRGSITNNLESIEYKPRKTSYKTFVACVSPKLAAVQARGESLAWMHWDEAAYYDYFEKSYESASSTCSAAREQAHAAGLACSTLITTTAAPIQPGPGLELYNFKNRALPFHEDFYDVEDVNALNTILQTNSKNDFFYLEYSHLQLGLDDKWLEERRKRTFSPETFDNDFLNRWTTGSGQSLIPQIILDRLLSHIEEPISTTIVNNIVLRWYAAQQTLDLPDIKNIPFILGADSSGMVGRDFTSLVMLNPIDMSVVMTCRCNESNLMNVAELIIQLMKRFPRLVFVPEKNYAETFIGIILHKMEKEEHMDPFKRIFNRFVQDKGDETSVHKHDLSLGSVRKQFGFRTTSETRGELYSKVLLTTVSRNAERIHDITIINEISGLIVRDGRIDHNIDGHDDTLIAYLIACWFIMFAKNPNQYGIHKSELVPITQEGEFSENSDLRELKERVVYLTQRLQTNNLSPMMQNAFTYELSVLKSSLERLKGSSEIESPISVHQQNENNISNFSLGTAMRCLQKISL